MNVRTVQFHILVLLPSTGSGKFSHGFFFCNFENPQEIRVGKWSARRGEGLGRKQHSSMPEEVGGEVVERF